MVKSSSTGNYSLTINDSIKEIDFEKFSGMDIMEIKFIAIDVIDIYLAEYDVYELSLEELMKIKVSTAGKQEQQMIDIPASVVVISRNEIEKMGYLYLKDIIRNIPGYYAMGNLGVDIFGVRGFAKDKGLNFVVLINGINITDDQILGYYDIPVQAIDKIEIIRGPMAVLYGDNAFFGVINIFTNTEKEAYFVNQASAMVGSNALINSFLTISNKINNLKYTIDCSYQKSEGANFDIAQMIKDPSRLDYPFYQGPNNNGLGVPVDARTTENKLNWNQKFFSLNLTDNHFYANILYIESMRKLYYYYPSLVDGSISNIIKSSFSLGYKKDISEKLIIDSKATYNRLNRKYFYDLITPTFNGIEKYELAKLQLQTDLFWKPNEWLNLSTGLEYNSILQDLNEGDVPQGGAPNYRYYNVHQDDKGNKLAFYTQSEFSFLTNFSLVAGVRFEKQFGYRLLYHENLALINDTVYEGKRENEAFEFYPRLALIYHLSKNHAIKLLYGKAGKQPTTEVIGDDLLDIKDGFKTTGYSQTEYITTYEINYIGKVSEHFLINASVFRNELNNLLIEKSFRYDPGIVRVIWTNRGEMKTMGIETTLTSKFSSGTQFELSAVYQKTDDLELATDASYSPDWLGYLKFYQPIYKGISFSVLGNYIDGMEPHFNTASKLDIDGNPTDEYIGRTSDNVQAYYTFDFQLKAEFPFDKSACFFSFNIQNVLNHQVRYPTFSINNDWADRGTLGFERSFNFTAGIKF